MSSHQADENRSGRATSKGGTRYGFWSSLRSAMLFFVLPLLLIVGLASCSSPTTSQNTSKTEGESSGTTSEEPPTEDPGPGPVNPTEPSGGQRPMPNQIGGAFVQDGAEAAGKDVYSTDDTLIGGVTVTMRTINPLTETCSTSLSEVGHTVSSSSSLGATTSTAADPKDMNFLISEIPTSTVGTFCLSFEGGSLAAAEFSDNFTFPSNGVDGRLINQVRP